MDENLKVLKGYINDSASAAHDVLLTTTDPDVGNAANNMLINSIRVGAVLEDISLKSEKIKSDKDIADAKQKLDNDRFENDKKVEDKKFNLEKDIQERRLKLDNEKLEFEKKKVEFEKDIQERRLDVEQNKADLEKDIQSKRLEFEKEKLEFEKEVQQKRIELETQRNDNESNFQEQKLAVEEAKIDAEKDIQEQRLKFDKEKLAYEKEEGERKAEEAKAQRKSDVKKVVIGGLIGVASVAVPVIIKAIVDAKAEDSKMAKTKAIFSAIYEAETEGVMPFSGEGGGLLRDICKEVITK